MPGYEGLDDKGTGKGKDLVRKANKAFSTAERYNAQRTWALMAEYILPSQNREWFGDVSKGIRRDRRVFDTTAVQANRDLAAAMHSTITNPAMEWSKLRFQTDELNDDADGVLWLQDATHMFHNKLSDSNFDEMVGKNYLTFSALGQFILFQDEEFNFDAWHLAEVAFVDNDRGIVDTIYRKFKMTLKAAYDKFGDAIGEDMIEKLDKEPLMELDFYHAIYPRKEEDVHLSETGHAQPKERPVASCYVMKKTDRVVLEEGFYEFPCYVCRWSNMPGETYGFGPGNVAIADVRSLNKLWEESLRALAKSVNPVIITTKQNMIAGDFRPGALTVVRDIDQMKEFTTQTNIQAIQFAVGHFSESIKSAFYIDKLMLPPRTETGEMTAYEVAQRLAQMQQILGPILSRLNTEFLNPLVMRSLKIMMRSHLLKPIPASVVAKIPNNKKGNGHAELDFEVMFVNSLARNQQMSELQNVEQFVQETMQLAQADPSALDKLDMDAIIDYGAKIRGIPEHLIKSDQDVAKVRADRQKQQQMQQGLAAAEQGSKAAKNMGQAQQAMQPQQGGNNE